MNWIYNCSAKNVIPEIFLESARTFGKFNSSSFFFDCLNLSNFTSYFQFSSASVVYFPCAWLRPLLIKFFVIHEKKKKTRIALLLNFCTISFDLVFPLINIMYHIWLGKYIYDWLTKSFVKYQKFSLSLKKKNQILCGCRSGTLWKWRWKSNGGEKNV